MRAQGGGERGMAWDSEGVVVAQGLGELGQEATEEGEVVWAGHEGGEEEGRGATH